MKRDLYNVLGVERSSSTADIRKAYRKKAAKVHPDNVDTGDAAQFQELNLAHQVLSDDKKRGIYDDTGAIPGEGGEDREKLAAFNLIFNLATQSVMEDPRGDIVDYINLSIRNSQVETNNRLTAIDIATGTITKAWKGAPAVKATILRGLEGTAAELRKKQKTYKVATGLMSDAKFDWSLSGKWDGVGSMQNRFNRLR